MTNLKVKVTELCLTLWNPMDYTVHEILQARILESFPSPGDLPNPGIESRSPTLQADSLPAEPQGKPMTNLESVLKSRDITLSTKVCIVKAMVFPIVLYGCKSWTIKKIEHWRIDAFEVWCWRRLLRIPWTAKRSNQSILKEINSEYSLEGLRLKLKPQYFGHLIRRTDSCFKDLDAGKDWRQV